MALFSLLICVIAVSCPTNALPYASISGRQTASADVTVIVQATSLRPDIIHEISRATWLQELTTYQTDGNAVVTLLPSVSPPCLHHRAIRGMLNALFSKTLAVKSRQTDRDVIYVAVGEYCKAIA